MNEKGLTYQTPEREGTVCRAEFLSVHPLQMLALVLSVL
jgi:hypothetical protein